MSIRWKRIGLRRCRGRIGDWTMAESITKSIRQILQEVSDDICDNYCKYRDTGDGDGLCELTRNGGECRLTNSTKLEL